MLISVKIKLLILASIIGLLTAIYSLNHSSIVSANNPIVLPIEVLGSAGTTRAITVNISSGNQTAKLWLQIHGLSYSDKASVQINNSAWIALSNTTAQVAEPGKRYGGIGGAFATLKLTVNVPPGAVTNGDNTIRFRFNNTDGISAGFRVLDMNFLDAAGARMLPPNQFVQENPNVWQPPRSNASDVAEGERLWRTAQLRESSLPNARQLKVGCADCHARSGRDLKYFNYSNNSIVERAKFHGLNQTQGEQIASYIRSLNVPNPGRPWNPPFQPGAGLDGKPVSDWSAGAGINAVLDKDSDSQFYLPGNAVSRDALVDGNHLKQVNVREIPLAFQLPDWNHWLPQVHPRDSMGDAFLSDPMHTRYTDLRQGLSGQRGMSKEQYVNELMRKDFDSWSGLYYADFAGMIAQNNVLLKSIMPPRGTRHWTEQQTREVYGAVVWSAVKQWEIMQDFELENHGRQFYGANGEARQWFTNRHIFNVSPHLVFGIDVEPKPVTGDGDWRLTNKYFANAWYELQLQLNPGSRSAVKGGFGTVDWGYTAGLMGDLSKLSGYAEPMRATRFTLKAMQERQNDYAPDGPGGLYPLQNAWWAWNFGDNRAGMIGSLDVFDGTTPNWSEQPNPRPIIETAYQVWMEQNARFTPEQWWRASHDWPARNYVLGNHGTWGNIAETHAAEIRGLRASFQIHEALLGGMADFGKSLWTNGGWDALKAPLSNVLGTPNGLIATVNIEQIKLAWSPVAGATSYNVKRSQTPNGIFLPIAYFVKNTNYTDKDLDAGTTYYYKISANNAQFEGNASAMATATPMFGLVGRWRFDGWNRKFIIRLNQRSVPSKLMQMDESVSNNHALNVHLPRYDTGARGNAIEFDGAKDFVSVRKSLHRWLGGTATLAMWIKTTATGTNDIFRSPGVIGTTTRNQEENPGYESDNLWGVLDDTGRIGARFFGHNGVTVKSQNPVNDGAWHHVAITRNAENGAVAIYVDGILSASGTSPTGLLRRRIYSIGRIDEQMNYWRGALDDVHIYNKVLSAAEVQNLYNDRTN